MSQVAALRNVPDTRPKPQPKENTARAEMEREEADELSQITYNIIFLNDLVMSCFVDMRAELMDSPYYRFKVKQTLNKAEKERDRYESMLHDIVKDKFERDFADMNQTYSETFDKDLGLLLFTIKNFLDRKDGVGTLVKAHVYRTKLMAQMAVLIWENRVNSIRQIKSAPKWVSLDFLHLGEMYRLCDELARLMGYYADEEHSVEVQKVVDILIDKLADGRLVLNALL